MDVIERARLLRKQIDEVASTLPDEKAMDYTELFPQWSSNGVNYITGNRLRFNGVLYKVLQSHTSQETWTPEAAPSLFAKVLVVDSTTIPEWEQPMSTNGYSVGDRVKFEGNIYESVINNNVWSPAAYPAGWKLVGEA